jgi:hypothetical protein
MNGENEQKVEETTEKTNEHAGFYFSSFIKITDPETNEVIVEMRGDN